MYHSSLANKIILVELSTSEQTGATYSAREIAVRLAGRATHEQVIAPLLPTPRSLPPLLLPRVNQYIDRIDLDLEKMIETDIN